jgi:hypothetical protein
MKVFISHSQETDALAKTLGEELKRAGMDVWSDEEILPGDNWAEKVGQALESSQAMVALLTPAALSSPRVLQDIEFALGRKTFNKRLIPVFVGSAEESTPQGFPWILKHLNMIQLPADGKQKEGINRITEALKAAA